MGHRLRRHPGLPSAGEIHHGLRSRDPPGHLGEGLRGGHHQIERDNGRGYSLGLTDADGDDYMLAGIYNWKGGAAGFLYKYINNASNRPTANFRTSVHAVFPYIKATFGPVYVEGEFVWLTGKSQKFEAPATAADVDKEGYGGYLLAKVNLGPAYVGGQWGYSSGDPNDTTKDKTGPVSTTSWVPCLLFGNANLRSWQFNASQHGGAGGTAVFSTDKTNLWLWNAFAGFNPTPKINFEARFPTCTPTRSPTVSTPTSTDGKRTSRRPTRSTTTSLTWLARGTSGPAITSRVPPTPRPETTTS